MVLILPYVEQAPMYNQYSASISNYKAFALQGAGSNDQNWRNMRGNIVPVYVCPSDPFTSTPGSRAGGNWARGNYGAGSGPAYADGARGGASPVLGVSGGTGSFPAGGVMCINWGVTLGSLTTQDGSSNTIMVNHLRSGQEASDMRGCWAFGLPGGSITNGMANGDCYGPNDTGSNSDDVTGCTDHPGAQQMGCWNGGYGQATARGAHTGGVPTCFGDGSVRFISNSIDMNNWFYMNSRSDGQSITWTD
jgi:hypothetical protein